MEQNKRSMDNVDGPTSKASGWKTLSGDPSKMVCVSKATYCKGGVSIMKSTKVVELPTGCLVQSTTEHSELGVAEAMVFVPGATMDQLVAAYS